MWMPAAARLAQNHGDACKAEQHREQDRKIHTRRKNMRQERQLVPLRSAIRCGVLTDRNLYGLSARGPELKVNSDRLAFVILIVDLNSVGSQGYVIQPKGGCQRGLPASVPNRPRSRCVLPNSRAHNGNPKLPARRTSRATLSTLPICRHQASLR